MSVKLIAAATLAALMCAGPALASPAENQAASNAAREMVQATIRHGDLDLTSTTDLARLKLRVERHARRMCVNDIGRDQVTDATLACRAQVLSSAGGQIDRAVQVAALRKKGKSRKG